MKFFLYLIITVCLVITGCATNRYADIKQGKQLDTYIVRQNGRDSLIVRQHLIEHALHFCSKDKLFMVPVARDYSESFYELTFRCLIAGDPELDSANEIYKKQWRHKKLGGYGDIKY